MLRLILAIPALVIPTYDALLHLLGALFFDGQGLSINLPWILWPYFESRLTYDLVWLGMHLTVAISVLGLVMTRKGKQ